jgi:hypothetical protein
MTSLQTFPLFVLRAREAAIWAIYTSPRLLPEYIV